MSYPARPRTPKTKSDPRGGISSNTLFDNFMTINDLINGLKHAADDHPCCRETIEAAITKLRDLDESLGAISYQTILIRRENTILRSSIETCVKDFEKTRWGWDGPCGTTDIIERLADSLSNTTMSGIAGDATPPQK